MSVGLRLAVFSIAVALILIIFWILKKGRIPTKFALVWLAPTLVILLVAIWPGLLVKIANAMGFVTIANFTIGILIIMLFFLIMALTVIISGQNTKIVFLIQEISILKKELKEKENE